MKKIILSAILFLGLTATGFSQERTQRVQKTPEERAHRITDALDKKLSLTDNQKTQIYQINLERAQAMSNSRGTKRDGKDLSNKKAQFEAGEDRILSILNDSQKATYNQLKAEREAKFKNRQGDHPKKLKK
ncbi:DUF4890 domain-containing protein [Pedobacter sp. P351]|uniref:DUF4890 domain-containing protein n=1 Tax=Pedobacter superstes TaxID=3133441 RepID=UPI003098E874